VRYSYFLLCTCCECCLSSFLLTSDYIVLVKLKGKVYTSCVRSCLIFGSETWPMKVEHEATLDRNEMSCSDGCCFSLKDSKKHMEVKELLGLEPVSLPVRRSRLRWFGRVECKDDTDWVQQCMSMEIEGT